MLRCNMKNYLSTHPFAQIGVFSLLLIPFVIAINLLSPTKDKIPKDFSSTIVAFEFANDEADLRKVLGPLTLKELKNVDCINYVDFGFMVFYSSFLFLFIKKIKQLNPVRFLNVFIFLPLFILFFDCMENVQLLKLSWCYTHTKECSDQAPLFVLLKIFTWSKWGGLAIFFSRMAFAIYRNDLFAKIVAGLLTIPMYLFVLAAISQHDRTIDQFTAAVFFMFALLTIYCFSFRQAQID